MFGHEYTIGAVGEGFLSQGLNAIAKQEGGQALARLLRQNARPAEQFEGNALKLAVAMLQVDPDAAGFRG